MSSFGVTYSKLRKYVEEQGGYDLYENQGMIVLSFVPSFPEALEKGAGSYTPRVIIHGKLKGDFLNFVSFQVEEENGMISKDRDLAELTYRDWIAYIEENY